MLKQKKAAVEIQFHWIYVMLVGAALMIFFGMAIYQQQKFSKEKRERELLNSLESAMRTVHSHGGLSEKIEIRTNLKRYCDTNSLAIGAAAKQGSADPIFSPQKLAGTSLMLGTVEWNVGFRASNFLLMTTDEEHFIIWYDDQNPESKALFEKIKKVWPEKIPYAVNQLGTSAKKTRILVLNTNTEPPAANAIKLKVTASSLDDFEKGQLHFGSSQLDYVGLASIFGALFSDTQSDYGCSMGNAYERLALVGEVYKAKAATLQSDPRLVNCKDKNDRNYYQSATLALTEIINFAENKDAPSIYDQAQNQLKPINIDLLKKSCPVIY